MSGLILSPVSGLILSPVSGLILSPVSGLIFVICKYTIGLSGACQR